MNDLTLTPAPGAAPLHRMVRLQASMETRLLLRNGEQLLLALVIPLLVLVAATRSGDLVDLGAGRRIDIVAPGVLALAVLSTSFTSVAIATGFERRYGILKRLGASPLPRVGLLAGKTIAVLFVELVQLVVLGVAARLLGWHPEGGIGAIGWLVVFVVLGTAAFGSIGMLMAGTLRAEATLAAANLVYVLLLVGGAVVVPLSRYPDGSHALLELLPSTALSEATREAFAGGVPEGQHFVVLLGWALVAGALTARTFKWE